MRRVRWIVACAVLHGVASFGIADVDPPELEWPFPGAATQGTEAGAAGPRASWGLPEDLLERLTLQAGEYEHAALRFSCRERMWGEDDGAAGSAMLLLVRDPITGALEEVRSRDGDAKPPAKKRVAGRPPAYHWLLLFSPRYRPLMGYRLIDPSGVVEFRGALPFDDGEDIRQWCGTAVIDPATGAVREVTAEPNNQAARLQAQRRRHEQRLALSVVVGGAPIWRGRIGKRPFGRREFVRFANLAGGLTLPAEGWRETLRPIAGGSQTSDRTFWRYDDCRVFRADARARLDSK